MQTLDGVFSFLGLFLNSMEQLTTCLLMDATTERLYDLVEGEHEIIATWQYFLPLYRNL